MDTYQKIRIVRSNQPRQPSKSDIFFIKFNFTANLLAIGPQHQSWFMQIIGGDNDFADILKNPRYAIRL